MKRFIFCVLFLASCNGFLDADLDKSLITEDKIFGNDVTATAAVTGMYNSIVYGSPLSGTATGMSALSGLSSGELSNYPQVADSKAFELHQISSSNLNLSNLWSFMYNLIYQANAILEGVKNSKTLSSTMAKQLEGEARFIRAFTFFYLVNLFGEVPLVLKTDYRENRLLSRRPVDEVYAAIENDLLAAQSLMALTYTGNDRARPNQATATALLARMYLYRKEYGKAETQAASVIDNSLYVMNPLSGIDKTFFKDSPEVIWQLASVDPGQNTMEGFFFIIKNSPPPFNTMTDLLRMHFETNDVRAVNWIGSYASGGKTFYFPYKYKQKIKDPAAPIAECSIVFRLAEMYLIRAEARGQLGKLVGANSALSDLNKIRERAGLPSATINDKETLLLAIENERWSELFTEYGHRWLDLKRSNRALEVLGNGITQDDLLWPIPAVEFTKNPNMGKQNPGY